MFNEEIFLRSLGLLADGDARALMAALDTEPPVSIRYNPYKMAEGAPAFEPCEPVAWCPQGYYLERRPNFTLDTAFHAGQYYVQEASSMFVGWLLQNAVESLEEIKLLDLCASPGGKTTLYSAMLGANSIVVANEVVRSRVGVLTDNVKRWGVGNVVVTTNDPADFGALGETFDVVAVDAPCSGEGMFRKDRRAREEWSPELVAMCAARQRRILADAWQALKPNGVLIYSTCTFNQTENEENIEWLTTQFEIEDLGVKIDDLPDRNIVITEAAGIPCFRFFPNRTKGEGFFACAVRKVGSKPKVQSSKIRTKSIDKKVATLISEYIEEPETMNFAQFGDTYYALPKVVSDFIPLLSQTLNVVYSGVQMGQIFKGRLKPEHALAMFRSLNRNALPVTELPEREALDYLRLAPIPPIAFSQGINLVTHRGLPLGWANSLGNRINNLYPKNMAIKNM